jgi:hypothetical protein
VSRHPGGRRVEGVERRIELARVELASRSPPSRTPPAVEWVEVVATSCGLGGGQRKLLDRARSFPRLARSCYRWRQSRRWTMSITPEERDGTIIILNQFVEKIRDLIPNHPRTGVTAKDLDDTVRLLKAHLSALGRDGTTAE